MREDGNGLEDEQDGTGEYWAGKDKGGMMARHKLKRSGRKRVRTGKVVMIAGS